MKAVPDSTNSSVTFCPAQKRAYEDLLAGLEIGSILRLCGGVGRGKTTVLTQVHQKTGGAGISTPRKRRKRRRQKIRKSSRGAFRNASFRSVFVAFVTFCSTMSESRAFLAKFYAAILVSCSTSAFLADRSAVTVVRP
jgi:hypothetical protein